ncbi:MAG: hypothetical protein GX617_15620 [Lentisphaerae bacterium]|nr:hypothetical protein [Lentisphaerota bacterium]
MMDATRILDAELKALRDDHKFMTELLQRKIICDMLGLGKYCDHEWRTYKDGEKASWPSRYYVAKSLSEVLSTLDMRKLLVALLWDKQSCRPKDLGTMADIGDDAFWLEFLHLVQADIRWSQSLWQDILDSASPNIPIKVRVCAWMFFLTRHRTGYEGKRLPQTAFEKLDHVQFDAAQKARWDSLVGFGLEALFKKQYSRVKLAMDMTPTELKDWLSYALDRYRPEFVLDLLGSHTEVELGMSYRDILLYVVANVHGDPAVALVRRLEELSPGICAGFRDCRGHNLLWYTASCWQLRSEYPEPRVKGRTRHQSGRAGAVNAWKQLVCERGDADGRGAGNCKLLAALIHYGVSPFEANEVGIAFNDLDTFARLVGQRWRFVRLRQTTPGFEDAAYWGFDAQKAR